MDEKNNIDPVKTGKFIKRLRENHNMTQEELGDKVFITRKAVSKWETGKCCPSIDMMKRLSNILGVTLEELTMGKYKDPAKNYEGKNPIVKLFLNKKARIIAIVLIIFVLTFVFINNIIKENKPTHYTIFYDGADYVLRKSEILKVGNQEYLSMGYFYSNRADTNDDTKYDLTLMIKEGSQYSNIISLTNINDSYSSKMNRIHSVINKLDDNMDNLYMKIEYINEYGENIKSDIQLNLNKDVSTPIVKKKIAELDGKMKKFNFAEKERVKNVDYQTDSTCKSENIIDLKFLFDLNNNERQELFNNKTIEINTRIYNMEYDINNNLMIISNNIIFINIDFESLKIILKRNETTFFYTIYNNKVAINNYQNYEIISNIIIDMKNIYLRYHK